MFPVPFRTSDSLCNTVLLNLQATVDKVNHLHAKKKQFTYLCIVFLVVYKLDYDGLRALSINIVLALVPGTMALVPLKM